MKLDVVMTSGDYTVTPFVEEIVLTDIFTLRLRSILARFAGNAAAINFGIFVAQAGLTAATLTAEIMAKGEVFVDTAVAAAADPAPELNITGQEIVKTIRTGESVYVRALTGDVAVSGDIFLEIS